MAGVAGFAQMAYDIVGIEVYGHAGEEHQGAEYEERAVKPADGVSVGRGHVEEPAAYHIAVDEVECRSHEAYCQGHAVFAAYQQREDERPLEVVQLE